MESRSSVVEGPSIGKSPRSFRRIVLYDNLDQAEADFENHKQCSRRVLEQAEIPDIDSRVDGNLGRYDRRLDNLFAVGTVR